MYQLRETLFNKFDSFGITYTENQKLFSNMAIFDFESIRLEDENFNDTETTISNGKLVAISVSILSNLLPEPFFFCALSPGDLVLSFIEALEILATQSKAQMNMNFLQIETATKSQLARNIITLNQHRSHSVVIEVGDGNSRNSSTQFI